MIEIPLNPITKKNHQQIVSNGKRPFVIQSKAYREYEKNAMYFIRPLGIDYPVNVKCLFYMKTHRRVDLVNLLEAIDDILVKAGALKDDNCEIVAAVGFQHGFAETLRCSFHSLKRRPLHTS